MHKASFHLPRMLGWQNPDGVEDFEVRFSYFLDLLSLLAVEGSHHSGMRLSTQALTFASNNHSGQNDASGEKVLMVRLR